MVNPFPTSQPVHNPVTHKAHSRQVLWQVTIPIMIGVMSVLTLVFLAIRAEQATSSLWADIALIFLIIPTMVVFLVFFILLAGMVYGLFRLLKVLPPNMLVVQGYFVKIAGVARTIGDRIVQPIIRVRSYTAGARALGRR